MTTATDTAPEEAPAAVDDASTSGTSGGAASGGDPVDDLSEEQLQQLLYDMMLIRRFEERTMQSYQQAKIGGFCHIYIGQEATAVGSIAALKDDDPIVTAYRDHGHALARGMDPNACMAEMYGKVTGCAKGKGGSMHMFDKPTTCTAGTPSSAGRTPSGPASAGRFSTRTRTTSRSATWATARSTRARPMSR